MDLLLTSMEWNQGATISLAIWLGIPMLLGRDPTLLRPLTL